MTPILIISVVQAAFEIEDARDARRNTLLVATESAIDRVEQTRARAQVLLRVFSEDLSQGRCADVFGLVVSEFPVVSSVGYVSGEGALECVFPSTSGETEIQKHAASIGDRESREYYQTHGFLSNDGDDWAYGLIHQVKDGTSEGSAFFRLKVEDFIAGRAQGPDKDSYMIALGTRYGQVVGSAPISEVPEEWQAAVSQTDTPILRDARDASGGRHDILIQKTGSAEFFTLVSQSSPGLLNDLTLRPARLVGLPLLAFVASLIAAWVATDIIALRWFERLRRLAKAYGAGHLNLDATRGFEAAPTEFAELADALDDMSTKLADRDAQLRDAVREVHHRVKNNLQIIRSFLRLQARGLDDPAASAALSEAQNRIDALAFVHQTLYQHERLQTVAMKPFLEGLLDYLEMALGMEDANIRLSIDVVDVERNSDDAIPIALLVLEAITNSVKYAFDAEGGEIVVQLKKSEQGLRLVVADNGCGMLGDEPDSKGLGSRLIAAFARQLGGEVIIEAAPDAGYSLSLEF